MDTIGEIASVLARCKDKKLIASFLKSILTEKEAYDFSKRWQAAKLLFAGRSQRSIRDELGVSLCKITRGSKELKKKNSALEKMIRRHEAGR